MPWENRSGKVGIGSYLSFAGVVIDLMAVMEEDVGAKGKGFCTERGTNPP